MLGLISSEYTFMHILLTIPEDVSDVEKVAEKYSETKKGEAEAAVGDKKCKQTVLTG